MITDGTFTFSNGQDLTDQVSTTNVGNPMYTSVIVPEVMTLADNYYDANEVGDSGGRVVYVHIHVDETIDTTSGYVDFRLLAWPVAAVPAVTTVNLATEVSSLLVPEARLTAGADLYLPVPVSSISTLIASERNYKYLGISYQYGITGIAAGKVTTALTDAISNKPRVFPAQNDT